MGAFYIYGGLGADLYDVTSGKHSFDIPFYLKKAKEFGDPVLELGAGTGRVTIPLAKAGFRIVGLDLSPFMLEKAKEKLAKLKPDARERIKFVEGNMINFTLSEKFSLVIIPFRAFQHLLTPEDQRCCLDSIHRHLEDKGHLIIDLFDPKLEYCLASSRPFPKVTEEVEHPETGNRILVFTESRSNDPATQTFTEYWRYVEIDERGKVVNQFYEELTLRWTYRYEMQYLFELSGFEIVKLYGDYQEGLPEYGKEQIWVVKKA